MTSLYPSLVVTRLVTAKARDKLSVYQANFQEKNKKYANRGPIWRYFDDKSTFLVDFQKNSTRMGVGEIC
jgi:hypothetical protein